MIETAKQEQKDDGYGWIIWGWLLFSASLLTWMNMKFEWFSTCMFWNLFVGITLAYILFEMTRNLFFTKGERVKTYTGELFPCRFIRLYHTQGILLIKI